VRYLLQVRQHTGHKRTFFYLEQLILKFNADQQCINIKEMHEVNCSAEDAVTDPNIDDI
jgi:NMD protein affecting ribosome stability and mRNA decay